MNRLTPEEIRAALKRKAPEGGSKAAVAKRPRATGVRIGTPAAAAPQREVRTTVPPPREMGPRRGRAADAGASSAVPPPPEAPRAPAARAALPGPSGPSTSSAPREPRGVVTPSAEPRPPAAGASRPSPSSGGARIGRAVVSPWEETPDGLSFKAWVGSQASALHDANVARALLNGVLLPRDEEESCTRSATEALSRPCSTLVQLIHDVVGIRSWTVRYYDKFRASEERLKSSEEGRKRAEEEASRLRGELAELRKSSAEERGKSAALLKEKADLLLKEVGEAARLSAELGSSESQRRLAISRSLALEERAKTAERELKAEKEKTRAAEGRASRAVEEYKRSTAFRDDVADMSVDVFSFGFSECRRQVAEAFPQLDLGSVVMPGEEEAGVEAEAEEGELPAETEAPGVVGAAEEEDGDEVVEVPPPTTAADAVEAPPPTAAAETVEAPPPTAAAEAGGVPPPTAAE